MYIKNTMCTVCDYRCFSSFLHYRLSPPPALLRTTPECREPYLRVTVTLKCH